MDTVINFTNYNFVNTKLIRIETFFQDKFTIKYSNSNKLKQRSKFYSALSVIQFDPLGRSQNNFISIFSFIFLDEQYNTIQCLTASDDTESIADYVCPLIYHILH